MAKILLLFSDRLQDLGSGQPEAGHPSRVSSTETAARRNPGYFHFCAIRAEMNMTMSHAELSAKSMFP